MKPEQPVGAFDETTGMWICRQDWHVDLSDGDRLHVRAGFQSDGASIPPILWPFVGPRYAAKTFPAALAHDALYAGELVSRSRADAEFYRLLRIMGVGRVKAGAYWSAVRAFGWAVWRRHSKGSVYLARKCKWVRIEPPVDLKPA
jgi:hypothetical protein